MGLESGIEIERSFPRHVTQRAFNATSRNVNSEKVMCFDISQSKEQFNGLVIALIALGFVKLMESGKSFIQNL